MKKKIIWLAVSGLLVLTMVLTSCGPAVTEEEEEEVVTEEEEEEEEVAEEEEEAEAEGPEMVRDALGKLVEKPKYGGVFIQVGGDPLYFDPGFGHQYGAFPLYYTNEKLIVGDWAKGPAGTDETTFTAGYLFPAPHLITGLLLEDWEIIDGLTIVMHVRQGVRWHDKPPVNGREFTADDVVYSMKYLWNTPRSFYRGVIPWDTYIESLTATDKWTVVLEAKPGKLAMVYEYGFGQMMLPPREVIEQYDDMMDWRNVIGTGPFELVDYVTGSSVTYERNPNYWRKDPLHPDNQLPYADVILHLVIPDASTQMAALRTGKVDLLSVGWENAGDVQRTNPELEYSRYLTTYTTAIFFRVDKPELPFYDKRVRRALSMAVNQQEMADTYYGGEAELITSPVANLREWADVGVLTPFEELPDSVRELFEYHPDKARELLTEAGYPNGFATTIPAYSDLADLLSIVKAYWADVGVDLTIDIKEFGAFAAIGNNLTHKELYIWAGVGGAYPFTFYWWTPESSFNYSQVYDPVIKETIDWFDGNYFNYEEKYPRYKEFVLYLLDQAYELQLPGQYAYMFWQPWLKNYHGEREVAYGSAIDVGIYIWIDQDLKEEMTGKR